MGSNEGQLENWIKEVLPIVVYARDKQQELVIAMSLGYMNWGMFTNEQRILNHYNDLVDEAGRIITTDPEEEE